VLSRTQSGHLGTRVLYQSKPQVMPAVVLDLLVRPPMNKRYTLLGRRRRPMSPVRTKSSAGPDCVRCFATAGTKVAVDSGCSPFGPGGGVNQAIQRPMLCRWCSRTGGSDCACASADRRRVRGACMYGSSGNRRTKHEVIKEVRPSAGLLGLVTTYSGWPLVGC
jgi:hypothetical protein